MSKVKYDLLQFLEKVESGNVTAQDIHNAQSMVKSAVIIPSGSILRKGRPEFHSKHRVTISVLRDVPQSHEYYTVQEVAERFNVTDKAVYKWIKHNKIESERTSPHSRDIRIPKHQFKNPPAEDKTSILEQSIFNDALEMELVNRKDLYHDED
ncbi:helix-turn-helix domain-containing protein [Paenibacillus sp. LMG 31459]|jgi:excisionase family DNA binding protein|uniref:Helix-turn-helix domain-containing protein n=1 Tax=Paenibacillus phytohabitans TaxID=2654978 RepID=A0ABX1YJE5_9BACL|nr:helix-turn-helix domain-containing protein [Paenibacillus phytohabitans]NOU81162.1 helix-turn-helix domain-containing protein [Paenibacillus phytohabitans]